MAETEELMTEEEEIGLVVGKGPLAASVIDDP